MLGFGPGNSFKTAKERCLAMNEINANTTTERNTNETVAAARRTTILAENGNKPVKISIFSVLSSPRRRLARSQPTRDVF